MNVTNSNKNYINTFDGINGVTGVFTTKYGASKASPFTNDELFAQLGIDNTNVLRLKQVHGNHIISVFKKPDANSLVIGEADGMITNIPKVALATVHADCVPIQLFDPVCKVVAAVHAGWRGTNLGIAACAVKQMSQDFGCTPDNIMAYIGPSISKCCFETDREVPEAFQTQYSWASEYIYKGYKDSKFLVDLKGINRRQLMDAGVSNIRTSEHCTYCRDDLFCSYRREGGTYMRMGSIIMLQNV